jgi:hypothetical protein
METGGSPAGKLQRRVEKLLSMGVTCRMHRLLSSLSAGVTVSARIQLRQQCAGSALHWQA